MDEQELRFMRALRISIPASLDKAAGEAYVTREAQLLAQINGARVAGT